jgi:hypothetical protein
MIEVKEKLKDSEVIGKITDSEAMPECKHRYVFDSKCGHHTDSYKCVLCGRIMKYHWGGG